MNGEQRWAVSAVVYVRVLGGLLGVLKQMLIPTAQSSVLKAHIKNTLTLWGGGGGVHICAHAMGVCASPQKFRTTHHPRGLKSHIPVLGFEPRTFKLQAWSAYLCAIQEREYPLLSMVHVLWWYGIDSWGPSESIECYIVSSCTD